MNTREHFKKQGLSLDWGKHKVVIEVGREKDKIVCSPRAFRYLKRAIEALNDIGYVDPILEGEMLDAEIRKSVNRKGRRDGAIRAAQTESFDYDQLLARIRNTGGALGIFDHGESNTEDYPIYRGRREEFILCTPDQAPLVQQLLDSNPYDDDGNLVVVEEARSEADR